MTVKEKYPHLSVGYLFERSGRDGFWKNAHDLFEAVRNFPADTLTPEENNLLARAQKRQISHLQNANAKAGVISDLMNDIVGMRKEEKLLDSEV